MVSNVLLEMRRVEVPRYVSRGRRKLVSRIRRQRMQGVDCSNPSSNYVSDFKPDFYAVKIVYETTSIKNANQNHNMRTRFFNGCISKDHAMIILKAIKAIQQFALRQH